MNLKLDFIAEDAIKHKKTSKIEAWFWSKVRNVFGDWCEECGRPAGKSDYIHLCAKCEDS